MNKDEVIKDFENQLSAKLAASDAIAQAEQSRLLAKLQMADDELVAANLSKNMAVRAERTIASETIAKMESRHKTELQQEMDAVATLTNLNTKKVTEEKQKAVLLVREVAANRKDAVVTMQSFGIAIVDLKVAAASAQRDQRKELTANILSKKTTIANLTSQLKVASAPTYCLKRVAKERDSAQELASKRQKKVVDSRSQVETLRAQLDAMKLLLDDTNKELAVKNQQLASLELLNHDLEQECSQATEEIVVSVYCFYIMCQYIYLPALFFL